MQKGSQLEFSCQNCPEKVRFSLFSVHTAPQVQCKSCKRVYDFEDKQLIDQLNKFVKLCTTLHECQDILSNTSVGVHVKGVEVLVPYNLLLTRLNSKLELDIGGQPCNIRFRIEPIQDLSLGELRGHCK